MTENNKNIIENRLSIVLGVLAILIAIIYLPVQIFLKVINMYPQEGAKYIYLHFLSSAFITCILFVVWFLLKFIYYEILSCNVLQKQYLIKKYRYKANCSYDCFIEHFRFSITIMLIIMFMAYLIFIIEEWFVEINVTGFAIIVFICMIIPIIVAIKCKMETMKKLLYKIVIYIVSGIVIYCFGLITILEQNTTSVKFQFTNTGLIEVNQSTNVSSQNLKLLLYEYDDKNFLGKSVYQKEFNNNDYLLGNIEKYIKISEDVNDYEGVSVLDEKIYAYTQFHLNNITLSDKKKYVINLVLEIGKKKIEIRNTFSKSNNLYRFSTDEIDKTF